MKKWIIKVSDGICVYVGNPDFRPDLAPPAYAVVNIKQPSLDHVWNGISWELSATIANARKREAIRAECNRRIENMFCAVCHQHDCQVLIGLGQNVDLPYTEAQMVEILQYRNALRTFPDSPTIDLDNPVYPVKPSFL